MGNTVLKPVDEFDAAVGVGEPHDGFDSDADLNERMSEHDDNQRGKCETRLTTEGLHKYYHNKPRINMFGDLARQTASVEKVPQFAQRKPMQTTHAHKRSTVEPSGLQRSQVSDYRQGTPISSTSTPGGTKESRK